MADRFKLKRQRRLMQVTGWVTREEKDLVEQCAQTQGMTISRLARCAIVGMVSELQAKGATKEFPE